MKILKVKKIGNSYVSFDPNNTSLISSYYYYTLNMVKQILLNTKESIHIIFGNQSTFSKIGVQDITLDFQIEHTLVKTGGRSVITPIYGNIPCEEEKYLIRIPNYNYYNSLDIVIEYSIPNIKNINSNDIFTEYAKKNIYLAPLVYDVDFSHKKEKNIMTSFIDKSQERRALLLQKMKKQNIDFDNINMFDHKGLCELLKKYKILLNIHQTNHHHTLEELRILPALCNGMIVISEKSPLTELIPYNKHIIWSSYSDIIDVCKDVTNNYNYYYNKLINNELSNILNQMKDDNYINLDNKIRSIIR